MKAPMEITFRCTECGQWISLVDSSPVAVVRCLSCGTENAVTARGVVRKLVMNEQNWISECSQDVYKQIQYSILEGFNIGEKMRDLTQRVLRELPTISKDRAYIVVQTELSAAIGESRFHSIKHAGFTTKRWEFCEEPACERHRKCQAQGAIPIDQPFCNGLMYPGDLGAGKAEECVGCRCYLGPGEDE